MPCRCQAVSNPGGDIGPRGDAQQSGTYWRTLVADPHVWSLHVIAQLVDRKYRYIRFGLIALGIAIALMLAAVLA
jgi:hypothetical protein